MRKIEVDGEVITIKRERINGKYKIVARDSKGRFVSIKRWSSKKEERAKAYVKVKKKAIQNVKKRKKPKGRGDCVEVNYHIRRMYKARKRPGKGDSEARNRWWEIELSAIFDKDEYEQNKTEIEEAIISAVENVVYDHYATYYNEPLASEMAQVNLGVTDEQVIPCPGTKGIEIQSVEINDRYGDFEKEVREALEIEF